MFATTANGGGTSVARSWSRMSPSTRTREPARSDATGSVADPSACARAADLGIEPIAEPARQREVELHRGHPRAGGEQAFGQDAQSRPDLQDPLARLRLGGGEDLLEDGDVRQEVLRQGVAGPQPRSAEDIPDSSSVDALRGRAGGTRGTRGAAWTRLCQAPGTRRPWDSCNSRGALRGIDGDRVKLVARSWAPRAVSRSRAR